MGAGASREREYAYVERYTPGEVFSAIKEECIVHPRSRLRDEVHRGVLWSLTHPPQKAARDVRPYKSSFENWSSSASVVGLRDMETAQGKMKVLLRIDGDMVRVFAPEDSFHGGSTVGELLRTQYHNVFVNWYKREDVLREIFP